MIVIHLIFILIVVTFIHYFSKNTAMIKNAYKYCLYGVLLGSLSSYLIANYMKELSTGVRIFAIFLITFELSIYLSSFIYKYDENYIEDNNFNKIIMSTTGLYILALPFISIFL